MDHDKHMPRGVVRLPWNGEYHPGRIADGVPTFRYRSAPAGLATRRQLRAAGLCPGGQDWVAQLRWRRGRRWARLYRLDLAAPKRVPTPAQLAALKRANTARRTCTACGVDTGHPLPPDDRRCWPCTESDHPDRFEDWEMTA
jgi:hypothetical protein